LLLEPRAARIDRPVGQLPVVADWRELSAGGEDGIVAGVLDERRLGVVLRALHAEAQRPVAVRSALAHLGCVARRDSLKLSTLGAKQAAYWIDKGAVHVRVYPRAKDSRRVLKILALVDEEHLDVLVRS